MRLYSVERVQQAEQTPEVAAHIAKTLERRRLKAAKDEADIQAWRKAREEAIAAKYQGRWEDALLDGCQAMYKLNHFAKIAERPLQQQIYSLKNNYVKLLYTHGYCIECYAHIMTVPEKGCFGCDATGFRRNGDECHRCGGTGIFKKEKNVAFVCFRFLMGDKRYCWHQPTEYVDFAYETTQESAMWDTELHEQEYEELDWEERRSYTELLEWIIKGASTVDVEMEAAA